MPLQCKVCGYDRCVSALDSHHTDPSQKERTNDSMGRWIFLKLDKFKVKVHSLISQLLNAGHSEALVRQIAGHRCESTIQRYRHIKAESLRALIERDKVVEIKRKVK